MLPGVETRTKGAAGQDSGSLSGTVWGNEHWEGNSGLHGGEGALHLGALTR